MNRRFVWLYLVLLTAGTPSLGWAQESGVDNELAAPPPATTDHQSSVSRTHQPQPFTPSLPGGSLLDATTGIPSLGYLADHGVRKEVELLDHQVEGIQEIQQNYEKAIEMLMREWTTRNPEHRSTKELRRKMGDLVKQHKAMIDTTLMPHQLERITQIALQDKIRWHGLLAGLLDEHVAFKLNIDNSQKRKLHRRATEIRKELAQKIAELEAQAEKDLLDELTTGQRNEFRELIGTRFVRTTENVEPPELRRRRLRAEQSRREHASEDQR